MLIRSSNIPVLGLVFSILGLIWSVFFTIGVGTDSVCITSGCSIIEDNRIAGISPWWAADALFFLMVLFSALRLRIVAQCIAALFLVGDCVFLLIMLFLAPCSSCLVLAVLLFCSFIFLSSKNSEFIVKARRFFYMALSLVWLVLFIMNLGTVVNDIAGPKLLYGNPEAKIDIYFSPSCPACRESVRTFGKVANFYAVAESDEDTVLIADLIQRINKGQTLEESMEEIGAARDINAYSAPVLDLLQELTLRFEALRNQARISRLGFKALPVIMFEGLPPGWAREGEKLPTSTPEAVPSDTPDLPEDLSAGPLECGPDKAAGCP
jgi:thiol-disulfide isomerase/thioredoxin